MHGGLFYQDNPLHRGHRGEMRTERQYPLLAKEHSSINMLILDLELLLLVAAVAFIVHSLTRMMWPWLKARLAKDKKRAKKAPAGGHGAGPPPPKEPLSGPFPRDLPPPSYATGVFAKVVHEKLSGPISEQELMPLIQEHLESFTIANCVHAVVKCGKLQVQPSPVYLSLVEKVSQNVPKLKPRGLAHVLWGIARAAPKSSASDLADALVDGLCAKCGELKQSDVVSVIWAVGELREGEKGFDRVKKVLSCALKALQASLPSSSSEDLVCLLETLASDQLAPPAGETAPAAPLVVTTCTALLAAAKQPKKANPKRRPRDELSLPLPESVKAVIALSHLCRQGVCGTDREPGELLRGLAGRVADVRTAKGAQFTTAVDTLAKLYVEDVGLVCFDKLARSAMLLNFQGLSRKHLVKLSVLVAGVAQTHELDCSSEFFLELAQQVNALEPQLQAPESTKVIEAFDKVGYASMLTLPKEKSIPFKGQ